MPTKKYSLLEIVERFFQERQNIKIKNQKEAEKAKEIINALKEGLKTYKFDATKKTK